MLNNIRAKSLIVIGGASLLFCFFALNALAAKPVVGTITPASGASIPNQAVVFTTTYTDVDGWQNIQQANLLINTLVSGIRSFYGYYNQNTNKLYLRNDLNTAWVGGYAPGSANIIQNSYAKLDCSKSKISGAGTTLTVIWNVTFKSTFMGSKRAYLYVKDDANAYNGWRQKGTWKINYPPAIGTLTPASGSTVPNQNIFFTTTATDNDGYANIYYVLMLINTSASGRNACYTQYNQNTNKLYLINDAGTSWLGGYTPGSANVIENSYAKLDCSKTTASGSSKTLTVKWAVTFKSRFSGAKNIYLYARDDDGAYTSWTQKGDYCVYAAPINP